MADRNFTAYTNVDVLAAALTIAAKERTRYTLNCVWIGREGIVTCDGKRLFWCKWDQAPTDANGEPAEWQGPPCMLEPRDVKTLIGIAKARKESRIAFNVNGKVEAFGQAFTEADGIYPAWQQVLPEKMGKGEPAPFDCELMAEGLAAVKRAWRSGRKAKDIGCEPIGRLLHMGHDALVYRTADDSIYFLLMGVHEKAMAECARVGRNC